MTIPPKLYSLAEDAGLKFTTSQYGSMEFQMDLKDGGSWAVLVTEAIGAPEEHQAIILSSHFYEESFNPQTGVWELDGDRTPDEFLNELIIANDERGIGAFGIIDFPGIEGISSYWYSATVSLKMITPKGLMAVLQSIASMGHEYQEMLRAY